MCAHLRTVFFAALLATGCSEAPAEPPIRPDVGFDARGDAPRPDQGSPRADLAAPDKGQDGPSGPCPPQELPHGGYCYAAVGFASGLDYSEAKQLCATSGAKVASILSEAENSFVYGILPAFENAAWIGLERNGTGVEDFAWADGSPLTYKNWASGEPNNDGGAESCTVIWGPALSFPEMRGKWNDAPCDEPKRDTVICKRPQ